MSRVQFVRQMLPRICKDYYEIEFQYTGNASATFDPTLTTSVSTTITWQPDDAPATVTTGTSHAFSYVPGSGSHRCKATVVGGLQLVATLDCSADAIIRIQNLKKTKITTLTVSYNGAILVTVSDIPSTTLTFSCESCYGKFQGPLSQFPRGIISITDTDNSTGLSGPLSDLPSTLQTGKFGYATLITSSSIANLVNIRDLRVFSTGWDNRDADHSADTVIDSIYANREKFVYTSPSLNILTGNTAPTGDYVDPLVTPGTGASDSNWIWDAGVSHHWPITSNAKRWYLVHGPSAGGTADTFSRWTIT